MAKPITGPASGAPARVRYPRLPLCIVILLVFTHVSFADPTSTAEPSPVTASNDATTAAIEAFSNPAVFWGTGVEAVIEKAYRECFRTYTFENRIITLRIPFAQNNERSAVSGSDLPVVGDGKADPLFIWDQIEEILATEDFAVYTKTLSDGRDKVIIFDLPERKWTVSADLLDIASMKAAVYRGLPHKPYVLSSGGGLLATDVYNYLYCVGRIGMDCSGFVWYILSRIAQAGGVDLDRRFARFLSPRPGVQPAFYVGTSLFNSTGAEIIEVEDNIRNLQPGDVMLFRDKDGTMAHSAVIQSVDLQAGVIRYLQCTDEAPYEERGVHDSFVRFDPARTEVSLKDESLEWTQPRLPPFPGERPSVYTSDGERYRAFPEYGGGKTVRIRPIAQALDRIRLGEE